MNQRQKRTLKAINLESITETKIKKIELSEAEKMRKMTFGQKIMKSCKRNTNFICFLENKTSLKSRKHRNEPNKAKLGQKVEFRML